MHIHTGKTYEHRVPDDEAQAWLYALIFTVKAAKAKTSWSIFREKYGHSAYSMMRAREADQEALPDKGNMQYSCQQGLVLSFADKWRIERPRAGWGAARCGAGS